MTSSQYPYRQEKREANKTRHSNPYQPPCLHEWGQVSRLHIPPSFPPHSRSFASAFLIDAISASPLQAPILRLTDPVCPIASLTTVQPLLACAAPLA